MYGQVQPVGMPVASAGTATLEAHVATTNAEHGQALAFDKHARGRPGLRHAGKVWRHLEQCPPRQRATGDGRRETRDGSVMEVRVELLSGDRANAVEGSQPSEEFLVPVSLPPPPRLSRARPP